jgi:hypothetical protein
MSVHVEYGDAKDKAAMTAAFRQDLATLRSWLE